MFREALKTQEEVLETLVALKKIIMCRGALKIWEKVPEMRVLRIGLDNLQQVG